MTDDAPTPIDPPADPPEPKLRKASSAPRRKSAGSAPARGADNGTSGQARAKAAPRPRRSAGKAVAPPVPDRSAALRMALIVAAVVVALDQLTKYVVVHALRLKEIQELTVWEPFLNLRMAWNQGINFGLFSSDVEVMRWILVGVAAVVCVGVAIWLWRVRPGRLAQVASGLLIGGAVGNVIDRIAYGAVADFLNMSLPGWRNPYSFNIADIAIFAGALGLVFLPGDGGAGGDLPQEKPRRSRARRDKTHDDKTRDGKARTR
ncbi:signal peptidase II [uncultured Paracoccus sp.]|uniref:signal peptidase II n=1 Tax=uncultured Paracoccus sp. TaxID=189685 RepID=UPI00261BF9EA|nr:signal peptidase II [uncultured Paracoccus sp.]